MIEPDRYEDAPLPGLELREAPTGEVEQAARRTIAALAADGLLEDRHAAVCQALVSVARAYDRAMTSAKAKEYAVANLHAQLLATLEALPSPEAGVEDDEWTKFQRELERAERERLEKEHQ